MMKELQELQLENTRLKEQLEETGKKYDYLELTHMKLKARMDEAEEKYGSKMNALDDLLALTKDDFQSKVSELEDIRLKLQEEANARESVEAQLKTQQVVASSFHEFFAEKTEEIYSLSGQKLKLSYESCYKACSLLSEARQENVELRQELNLMEEEKKQLNDEIQDYQDKITQLQEELKNTEKRIAEQEDRESQH